jgi:hypothetical protein
MKQAVLRVRESFNEATFFLADDQSAVLERSMLKDRGIGRAGYSRLRSHGCILQCLHYIVPRL